MGNRPVLGNVHHISNKSNLIFIFVLSAPLIPIIKYCTKQPQLATTTHQQQQQKEKKVERKYNNQFLDAWSAMGYNVMNNSFLYVWNEWSW